MRKQFPKEVKKTMRDLGITVEEEEALFIQLYSEIKRDSKIFHAALQLLKYIYKGMIILIAICFLLPTLLFVLMCTHVICISDKITLLQILRIRDDHREMR